MTARTKLRQDRQVVSGEAPGAVKLALLRGRAPHLERTLRKCGDQGRGTEQREIKSGHEQAREQKQKGMKSPNNHITGHRRTRRRTEYENTNG